MHIRRSRTIMVMMLLVASCTLVFPTAAFGSQFVASAPVSIPDQQVPMTTLTASGTWSVVNLVLMLFGLIEATVLLVASIMRHDTDVVNEDTKHARNRSFTWVVLNVIVAVCAVLVFFMGEDISQTMIYTDKLSPLMASLVLGQIVISVVSVLVRNPKPANTSKQVSRYDASMPDSRR